MATYCVVAWSSAAMGVWLSDGSSNVMFESRCCVWMVMSLLTKTLK